MSGHHVNYFKIYIILMVLFIISAVVPEMTENQVVILISAFGIAVVKSIMVIGWFMHFAFEKKYIWYLMITCCSFLFLFYIAVAPDVRETEGQNWNSTIPALQKGDGHESLKHLHHHDDHGSENQDHH